MTAQPPTSGPEKSDDRRSPRDDHEFSRQRFDHFGRFPFRPPFFGHRITQSLLKRDVFRELQDLIFLSRIIQENEGITGYVLQNEYNVPRGNLLRILDELESDQYLLTEERVESGRTQKLYKISDQGKNYLNTLRIKWAFRLEELEDLADFHPGDEFVPLDWPPRRAFPYLHKFPAFIDHPPFPRHGLGIHDFEESIPPASQSFKGDVNMMDFPPEILQKKEDLLDFLYGERSRITQRELRIKTRMEFVNEKRLELEKIIEDIEQLTPYSSEKAKEILLNRS